MPLQVLEAQVPAVAQAATGDQTIGEVQESGRVSAASYTPEAAITGAASPDSRTFTVVNKGADGNGTTVVATLAMTAGVDAADFDETAMTLSAVAGATTVAAGDVLAFVSTAVTGAGGLADPGGHVQIEIESADYTTTVGATGAVTHTEL